MSTTFRFEARKAEVILRAREWCGVGQAEHFDAARVSVIEAEQLAKELGSAIKAAKAVERVAREEASTRSRERIRQLKDELQRLEANL